MSPPCHRACSGVALTSLVNSPSLHLPRTGEDAAASGLRPQDLKNNAKITDYYVRAQSLAQQQQIIERAKRYAARNSRVVREAADDEDSDDDDWGSEDAVAQSMTTSVADWNDLMPSIFGKYIAEYFPIRFLIFIVVFSIVILLNAAAFFFLTTHGESLQLSYSMPFLTKNAKEAVGEVVGFIPPHVTLNSAALWVACKRPEETTALSIIKASVHNACPGAISAALAWTFLEFFASKVLSGIFEEGTFFGEVMLGILRTSVKHAESARDEAASDESSSTVSILLNSFLLIYLFTHPIFFFLLFGVVGSFRKGFRSQVREGEAYERFQTRALRLPRRAGYVGCV